MENETDLDPMKIYDAEYLGITMEEPKFYSSKDIDLDFEAGMDWRSSMAKLREEEDRTRKETDPVEEFMKKSVITSSFEKLRFAPPYEPSKRQLQARKRIEQRKAGAGGGWFNMRAPRMTPEIKHDLEVLQMRSALDPKQFYKKNDRKGLPKHFHIGKIMDSATDYYSSRLTKKERKRTIVDELMANVEFTKYNKRKYREIIEEKKKTHYKAHRQAKKLKGKKR
ncbi:PREDICTED: deoxynucleotidyltransferase terminal-interacting protein 2 [Dinoponera quadriceps]|uniref:Deoxynucleotidyltransferase terminal-interacting protein 2 n=1 Tax=Dinoponera quadriceps TaxID=609295 RepID=A0A6P3WSC6_DINQU|nr:PREDICTED: deoxynucleotidyltransferase terminal-interacting protein 2 [Dinoponera quadriceps]